VGYFFPGRIFWSHPKPTSHFFPDFKSGTVSGLSESHFRILAWISIVSTNLKRWTWDSRCAEEVYALEPFAVLLLAISREKRGGTCMI
jgi:hypothetical protein